MANANAASPLSQINVINVFNFISRVTNMQRYICKLARYVSGRVFGHCRVMLGVIRSVQILKILSDARFGSLLPLPQFFLAAWHVSVIGQQAM